MMADAELTQEQVEEFARTRGLRLVEAKRPPIMVPKHRLDEVIAQRNELRDTNRILSEIVRTLRLRLSILEAEKR